MTDTSRLGAALILGLLILGTASTVEGVPESACADREILAFGAGHKYGRNAILRAERQPELQQVPTPDEARIATLAALRGFLAP